MLEMFEKGKRAGIETRGIADHGFIDSIYFRDPNGYVIELTCRRDDYDQQMSKARAQAHEALARWQRQKPRSVSA
jgi:catechol-2,3-dioxygenase